MKWVDQAVTRPFRCAVVPYVGNGSGHSFIDTGQDLDLEHVYISDVAAEQIAQMVGFVSPKALDAQAEEVARLKEQIEELEQENSRLQDFYDHADGLVKHGMRVARPAGRPPKKEKV